MLRHTLGLAFLALFISRPSVAETTDELNAVAAEEVASDRRSSVEFLPQVSIVSASELSLSTPSYSIPFAEALQGIPTISLGMRIPTGTVAGFETALVPRIGYGYKSGPFSVNRPTGASKENLRLHTVPASLLFQALYEIPGVSGLKFGANLGVGALYVFQNGNVDALNQSYLLPCLFVGPAVSFMDYGDSEDWFHGFTFGVTLQNSFASKQVLRAFSVDLGINIAF